MKELAEKEAAAAAAKQKEIDAIKNSLNTGKQDVTTLVSPGGLSIWTSPVWEFLGPVSDERCRFDFRSAIQCSTAMGG